MKGCKYTGDGTDLWLPKGKRCEADVMLDVDKSQPSKRVEWDDGESFNVYWPSKKHESGLCFYHWNKERCKEIMEKKGR